MRRMSGLLIVLLHLIPVLSGNAHAFETNEIGFPLPVMDKYTVAQDQVRFDATEKVEGKETVISSFLNLNPDEDEYLGFKVWIMGGYPFAYLVNKKDTVNGKVTYGYTLLDNDGDGVFETKYAANEKFDIPEWAIQRALEEGASTPPPR